MEKMLGSFFSRNDLCMVENQQFSPSSRSLPRNPHGELRCSVFLGESEVDHAEFAQLLTESFQVPHFFFGGCD